MRGLPHPLRPPGWRELWPSTRWGAVALICVVVVAMVFIDPHATRDPKIDRLQASLAGQNIGCGSPQYWWSDAKGRSVPRGRAVLNCDRYEIDIFNNHGEVTTFVRQQRAPRNADPLRKFGISYYLVVGPRWLLITPREQIAAGSARTTNGRVVPISTSSSASP